MRYENCSQREGWNTCRIFEVNDRMSWLKREDFDEKVRSGRGKTSRLVFLCVMCGEYASLDGACCREHENLQSFVGDENSG